MPANLSIEPISPFPSVAAGVRTILVEATALLGPIHPLPALFEEVLRAWRGFPVRTDRLTRARQLLASLQENSAWPSVGMEIIRDGAELWEVRLLAATLLAMDGHGLPIDPPVGTEGMTLFALANFTREEHGAWYYESLQQWVEEYDGLTDEIPPMLPLICFLRCLHDNTLSPELFASAVLHGGLLHPDISSHRPLRHLHRLLDYLGLSAEPHVQLHYRQLVAGVWPGASAQNWQVWRWITVPGGPDIFPQALRAVESGELTFPRLHELKYAPLPSRDELSRLLVSSAPTTQLLLHWLRPGLSFVFDMIPGGGEALRWLQESNLRAADIAYANPPWWGVWCQQGLPIVRDAMALIQAVELPLSLSENALNRHDWLEKHLLPGYRRICANLLLAQAAIGEGVTEITTLAEDGDLAALRALALAPEISQSTTDLLQHLTRKGGRPAQAAARAALDYLARHRGLAGVDEMERQHVLASAWELGPLAGERVRVGWQEGGYRLRLQLHNGRVQLDILGPNGLTLRPPEALRHSDAYLQARAAQREVQAQYRLFKQHLERYMLEARPIAFGEFRYLMANPIFAHLAERLVWTAAEGDAFLWAGPERWETHAGEQIDLTGQGTLTLAHPVTLAAQHRLVAWQMVAADRRLMQPFKQLFREVYLAEAHEGTVCERFAGRSIDPSRAYALLRAAGYAPGTGVARHEWPGGITGHLRWARDVVSHDLFGPQRLSVITTGDIWFTRSGETISLTEVAPIVFSETLRAADLLTTRAATGDADLTSRETIALRASLLREMSRTFELTNIAVLEDGQYALVLGTHATYRVNLASGTILLEPEGRQIMLSPHDAGWCPVEGSDATSEVLAIVLTLAHDHEIADLTFRAQIPPREHP